MSVLGCEVGKRGWGGRKLGFGGVKRALGSENVSFWAFVRKERRVNKKDDTTMLVNIFKKNYLVQLLLLVVVPLAMWMPAFVNPPEIFRSSYDMVLYKQLCEWTGTWQRSAVVVSFLIIYLQALLLNYLFTQNHLCQKATFLPALLYLMLMSCDVKTMTFSALLFSNFCVIIALHFFFKCYSKKEGLDEIFQASFFLAIASLFYAPSVLFILWIWCGLVVYKLYKWRSWGMSILGLATPYLLLCVFYYLSDISIEAALLADVEKWLKIDTNFLNVPVQVVYMALLAVYLVPSLVMTLTSRTNRIIEYRKKSGVMVSMFVISLFVFFLSKTSENMSFVFAIPFAFFLCNLFMSYSKEKAASRFLLIFIICCVAKVYFRL